MSAGRWAPSPPPPDHDQGRADRTWRPALGRQERGAGPANVKRRSVGGGHRLARTLGGALGEGYLGATVSGLTCLVGAHDAWRRASVGGLLCVAGAGARGALLPTTRIRCASGGRTPQGGRLPLSARSLPVRLWRRTLSKFFFGVCLLSNPQSLQVGGIQWALAAASDPPPRDLTSRPVRVPLSFRGAPVRPCGRPRARLRAGRAW